MKVNILNDSKKELVVDYDYIKTPFGLALLMLHDNKICYLGFAGSKNKEEVLAIAKKSFKKLKVKFNKATLQNISDINELDIILIGTPFQIKVWQALLTVENGKTISYEDLSKKLLVEDKAKNYTRATANAVANNKISYIVPCHRIIKKMAK